METKYQAMKKGLEKNRAADDERMANFIEEVGNIAWEVESGRWTTNNAWNRPRPEAKGAIARIAALHNTYWDECEAAQAEFDKLFPEEKDDSNPDPRNWGA